MTRELWALLASAIRSSPHAPDWLKAQSRLTYEEVIQLQPFENSLEGRAALPTVQEATVRLDYLEFLREQIRLGARGQEWTALIQLRLAALAPLVGQTVTTATFHLEPNVAVLRLKSGTDEIVFLEVF